MNSVIGICCYLIALLVVLFISTLRFKLSINNRLYNRSADVTKNVYQNISFIAIIFIALVFVAYNVVVTKINPSTTHDRLIYTMNFYGYRKTPSIGLSFIIDFIHSFSTNVEWLYYLTTFICMIITFAAYKIDNEASTKTILFLLATQYVFFSLEGLKQAYANAFAVLCIALAIRNDGLKDKLLSIASIVGAILFHHTGYFLIPVYIMIRIKKNKRNMILSFLFFGFFVILFEPLLTRFAVLISPFSSFLATKITQYFGEDATESLQTEGYMTVVKGIPFYVLTIVGWFKRRKLVDAIRNYDNYLLVSGILSFTYLATIYNSWVYRLSYFFLLPVGVFFSILFKNIENRKNRYLFAFSTVGIIAVLTLRFVILMYLNYGGF